MRPNYVCYQRKPVRFIRLTTELVTLFLCPTISVSHDISDTHSGHTKKFVDVVLLNSEVNTVTAEVMSEWSVSEQRDNAGFTGFTLQCSFVIGILQVHVQFRVGQKYRYTVTGRFGPESFRPWVFSAWVVSA